MNKSRFPKRFAILKSTLVFLETVLTQTFIPETLDSVPQAITLDTLLTITLDTPLLANEILGHSIIHNLGHSTTHNSGFRTSGHSSTITLDTLLLANKFLYIPFFLVEYIQCGQSMRFLESNNPLWRSTLYIVLDTPLSITLDTPLLITLDTPTTITLDTLQLANKILYICSFLLNKYSVDRQWGSWKVIIHIDGPHCMYIVLDTLLSINLDTPVLIILDTPTITLAFQEWYYSGLVLLRIFHL